MYFVIKSSKIYIERLWHDSRVESAARQLFLAHSIEIRISRIYLFSCERARARKQMTYLIISSQYIFISSERKCLMEFKLGSRSGYSVSMKANFPSLVYHTLSGR